jgi:hypothetical protein
MDHLALPSRTKGDRGASTRRTSASARVSLGDRDAVLALRDRLLRDGVELVEEWDEADYVSVKCRDPDGYIVEASWEPGG